MKCIILGTSVDCPSEPVFTGHETYYGMDAAHWKTLAVILTLGFFWGIFSAVRDHLLARRTARRRQAIVRQWESGGGLSTGGDKSVADRPWYRSVSKG